MKLPLTSVLTFTSRSAGEWRDRSPVDDGHARPALGDALLREPAAEALEGHTPRVPPQHQSEQVLQTARREDLKPVVGPEPDGNAGAGLGPGGDGVSQRGQGVHGLAEDALIPGVDERLVFGLPRR